MIPETNDPRRIVKRWSIALLVVTVAAMAVIRTVSVRHRSHGPRGSVAQGTEGADDATGRVTDGGKTPNSAWADPLSAFE